MSEPLHSKGDILQIRINRVVVSCLVIDSELVGGTGGNEILMRRTKFSIYLPMKDHLASRNHIIYSPNIFTYSWNWDPVRYYILLVGDKKVSFSYETFEND